MSVLQSLKLLCSVPSFITSACDEVWWEPGCVNVCTRVWSWVAVPSCSATAGCPSCRGSRTAWRGCCGRWRRSRLSLCAWGRQRGCPPSSRTWTPAGSQSQLWDLHQVVSARSHVSLWTITRFISFPSLRFWMSPSNTQFYLKTPVTAAGGHVFTCSVCSFVSKITHKTTGLIPLKLSWHSLQMIKCWSKRWKVKVLQLIKTFWMTGSTPLPYSRKKPRREPPALCRTFLTALNTDCDCDTDSTTMHIQIKAIKLSELRGGLFQLWKQKGTFNPAGLYYELCLKMLSVMSENKRTPSEQWKGNEMVRGEGVLFMSVQAHLTSLCA